MAEVCGRYGVQIFDGRWLRVDPSARTLWPAATEPAEVFYVVIAASGELRMQAESVQGWLRVDASGLLLADASEAGATSFTSSLLARLDQPSFSFGVMAPGGRSLRVPTSGPLTTAVGDPEASSLVRFTSEQRLVVSATQRPIAQPVARPSLSTGAEQKLKRMKSG